jgi:glycosyltransferase involved in cell wall biosynthesis
MARSVCFVGHLMLPLLTGSDEPVVGGAEVQSFHLAAELQRRGWQTSFLVCSLDGTAAGTVLATPYGPAQILYPRHASKTPAIKLQEKRALFAAIRASDASLVFQRAVWDADVAAIAARRNRIPYVYSLASDRDALRLPFLSRRRNVLRWATAVAAQSAAQRESVRRYGRDATIIPTGFPVPTWQESGRNTVLWVGTLRALKRPGLFLDLAAEHPDWRFVLCGGPGEDPRVAEQIAARAAHLPNVDAAGFVPYARMPEYFARARVIINTSEYEGFPNTFVLAWLYGAVVLALGVDPDGWLSRGGLGAVARDAPELSALLRRALTDDEWTRATMQRARRHAERVHDIGPVTTAFEALFETALRHHV